MDPYLPNQKKKILFLLPLAEAIINERYRDFAYTTRLAGGAELQSAFIALELRELYDVSFASMGLNASELNTVRRIEGIDFHKVVKFRAASRLERAYNYIVKVFFLLIRVSPHLVYIRANASFYFPLWVFLALSRKKCIVHISSDAECRAHGVVGFLKRRLIAHSHRVVCQTLGQKKLIDRTFGCDSIVVRNYYPPRYLNNGTLLKEDSVLWVANLFDNKQPFLFLSLAKRNPQFRFVMIGPKATRSEKTHERVMQEILNIPNLNYYDFVPFFEAMEHFRKAKIFVNTSLVEGFPNSFLQAWANDCAVVSLNVDPDDVFTRDGIGVYCSGDEEQMNSEVRHLIEDENKRKSMVKRGREFLRTYHSSEDLRLQIVKLFS